MSVGSGQGGGDAPRGKERAASASLEFEATAAPDASAASDATVNLTGPGAAPRLPQRRSNPALAGAVGQRYGLGGALGAGAMGEVHVADDRLIHREVAVKRMISAQHPELVQRFLREARIQGRLEHPAIVPVHDLGVDEEGRPYFVMKRLAGVTLREVLDGAAGAPRLARRRLLEVFVSVCRAIEFAHQRGVVHRDLKPSNLMVGEHGEVYVLDWGIARALAEVDPAWREVGSLDGVTTAGATLVGTVMGTPGYMAPEQARGEPVDGRADVYALGAILFELLVGAPLAPRGVMDPVDVERRPAVRAPSGDVPPELDAACARALARDPAQRWPTARALADAVQGYLDGDRDLEARRVLAQQQVQAAQAARRAGDQAAALAAAGRAVALAPEDPVAAGLLGQLMLEPPAEVPAEVVAELGAQDDAAVRREARRAIGTFGAYLLALPLLLWNGIDHPTIIAVIYALIGACGVDAFLMARARTLSSARLWASYGLNMTLIAALSMVLGPFVFVPATATAVVILYGGFMRTRRALGLAIAGMVAIVGPWALEQLHVLPTTTEVVDGVMRVRSYVMPLSPTGTTALLLLHACGLMVVAATASHGTAAAERRLRQERALQAWKLRQLMPS
jgi:hypothetical protein